MIESDTWYKCNICGREGCVGRCCRNEDRTPLNDLARAEQERIKRGKMTAYESLKRKEEVLIETSRRAESLDMKMMWLAKAKELQQKTNEMTVEEAEREVLR